MKKFLIGLILVVAFSIAGFKIYQYYQSTQPPYQVGECIELVSPEGILITIQITDNVQERQTSVVVVKLDYFGQIAYQAGTIEYQELKAIAEEFKARKVTCEEIPQ